MPPRLNRTSPTSNSHTTPLARIAYLEQECRRLFNDNAIKYSYNTRTATENQDLSTTVQELLADNLRLAEEKADLDKKAQTLAGDIERQEAKSDATISDQKEIISRLRKEKAELVRKVSEATGTATADCYHCFSDIKFNTAICQTCFLPGEQRGHYQRFTRINIESDDEDEYSHNRNIHISDSDDDDDDDDDDADERRRPIHPDFDPFMRNIYHETRLEPGAFDWLVDFAEKFMYRVEHRRKLDRKRQQPEMRRLAEDLLDVDEEIERAWAQLANVRKKKKKKIQHKLLVLGDAQAINAEGELSIKKKMFVFCRIMGRHAQSFRNPAEWDHVIKNQRQLLKIFHQGMSVMRVLHEEMIEKPKLANQKHKTRKPLTNKWQILQAPYDGQLDRRLEELFASSEEEVRMACTALQNMLWLWQEGILPDW